MVRCFFNPVPVAAVLLAAALSVGPARAATVETSISGLEGPPLANVRASLSLLQAETLDEISIWRLRQMASDADEEVRVALQPYGYYNPRIAVRLVGDGRYRAR